MKLLKGNIFLKLLIVGGVLFFSFICYIVINATSVTTAIVPNKNLKTGTTITADMLKEITVPKNTPGGFIKDKTYLIGQKLKIDVKTDQLLYATNVISSYEEIINNNEIPSNYVITAIEIPMERACGGIITSGDFVDILGVPNASFKQAMDEIFNTSDYYNMSEEEKGLSFLGEMYEKDSFGVNSCPSSRIYWVLANVKILETNSLLSSSEGNIISDIIDNNSSTNGKNFYIIALSYADYLKLKYCARFMDFNLSICPSDNSKDGVNYKEMRQQTIKQLLDSLSQDSSYLIDYTPENNDATDNKVYSIQDAFVEFSNYILEHNLGIDYNINDFTNDTNSENEKTVAYNQLKEADENIESIFNAILQKLSDATQE